ncbi:MAG: hypothetical protein HN995_05040 [Candidatus Marinimicrobia bacterium]|jgi:hypothetical protein|nr:hypothetical protein [Candidatus Neomarinimicrobiota bacterium]MBT3574433.1 hypothetical protein [Candidatus Neomarinimicrobiota bacterium]MBT3680127.1 hypothetical protein [Candidatus Neomarinimicrobiota bacterium]MBT3951369.1 hypothetical protein [Candidatus Neomarinimicrobiota bacterium]MBT4253677.1 hypothetical protein [Candidatus Neomarinimicrobiota bacterium]
MESNEKISTRDIKNIIQVSIGVIGVIGLLIFGWPSPDSRPKIYELYLAGVWTLIALSGSSSYWSWKDSTWANKIMAIAAPIAALLYLQKYFMS